MNRAMRVAGMICASLMIGGCSGKVSGGPESGADVGRYRSFHVVTAEKSDVANAIEKELTSRGFTASKGSASSAPPGAEAKVLFDDKWVWDMTMYLLEVKIDVVDARTGALVGSGRSHRTSMARKSAPYMVKEVMDKIFGPAPAAKARAS